MTDKEIIKALKKHSMDLCSECKVEKTILCNGCISEIQRNALDLINRQQAEIERLQNESIGNCELAISMRNDNNLKGDCSYCIDKAKAEAKKEFVEELIYKIVNTPTKFESTYYMYREGIAFRQNEIIDIIKEMEGEIDV